MANPNSLINLSNDSFGPHLLHPKQNLGALLISEVLTGENYIAWSKSISIALTVKNKITFMDKVLFLNPVLMILQSQFLGYVQIILCYLDWSIQFQKKFVVAFFISPMLHLWNNSKIKYLRSDGPRVFSLEKSLSFISQGLKSITKYFNDFKKPLRLIHQLLSLSKL